jgi:hypothetical protein
MAVVRIRKVRMRMHQPLVPVRMHVRLAAVPRKVVRMLVVCLVHVLVRVLERLVRMRVFMMLREMQPYGSP